MGQARHTLGFLGAVRSQPVQIASGVDSARSSLTPPRSRGKKENCAVRGKTPPLPLNVFKQAPSSEAAGPDAMEPSVAHYDYRGIVGASKEDRPPDCAPASASSVAMTASKFRTAAAKAFASAAMAKAEEAAGASTGIVNSKKHGGSRVNSRRASVSSETSLLKQEKTNTPSSCAGAPTPATVTEPAGCSATPAAASRSSRSVKNAPSASDVPLASKLDAAGAELRVDPEDGKAYTLNQLKVVCAGTYTDSEVYDYWVTSCHPVDDLAERYALRIQAKSREASLRRRQSVSSVTSTEVSDKTTERAEADERVTEQRQSDSLASLVPQGSGNTIGKVGRAALASARSRFLQRQQRSSPSIVLGGGATPSSKDEMKHLDTKKLGSVHGAVSHVASSSSSTLAADTSDCESRRGWEMSRPELFGLQADSKNIAKPMKKRKWPCPAPPGGWPRSKADTRQTHSTPELPLCQF